MARFIWLPICLLAAACQPPSRGKDYLKKHPEELSNVSVACADGSHRNPQECANAEDIRILNQKLRSLKGTHDNGVNR